MSTSDAILSAVVKKGSKCAAVENVEIEFLVILPDLSQFSTRDAASQRLVKAALASWDIATPATSLKAVLRARRLELYLWALVTTT